MGNFINIGIQQKGIKETVPYVMTDEAMQLFEKVLPPNVFLEFSSCYSFSYDAPKDSAKHIAEIKYKYFLKEENKETAQTIYENALVAALIFAQESFADIENIDFNALYNVVSLKYLYNKLEHKTLSIDEAEHFYSIATNASPAVKNQISSMLLPYIYEDADVNVTKTEIEYIIYSAGLMLVCTIGQLSCMIFVHIKASKISADVENDLRKDLVTHTSKFGKKEFRNHSPEKINSIINADVNRVGMVTNYFLKMFMCAPLLALGGTILSLQKSVFIGALILITAVVIIITLAIIFKITEKKYEIMNNIYSNLSKLFNINIEQILTIRAANTEKSEIQKISTLSSSYQKNENFVMRSVFIGLGLINLITNVIVAIMVLIGGNSMLNSNLTLGDMVTFLQYALLTISAFMVVGLIIILFPTAMLSINSINTVLSQEIQETTDGTIKSVDDFDIQFEEVQLAEIPNAQFSFNIPQGAKIGITGCTGCGKTTLMELLLLRSSPAAGKVYIGGSPINQIDAEFVRKKISYAQSISVLFTKTLRENLIIYGCENNDDKMLHALENAQCDFLPSEPLDRIIMNAGANFSGGQKSRLAIAGALGKDAEIYIFDDCFTALDSETEEKILNKLVETKNNATIIIISQRVKSIMNCDKIIVLSENGVESEGTHQELMESSPYYSTISKNQLSEVIVDG